MPEPHDSFAEARLVDSLKILKEREEHFQITGHQHIAQQDLSGGGFITETVTVVWRPKPAPVAQTTNGYSHGRTPTEES